jgi:hypothetical protein
MTATDFHDPNLREIPLVATAEVAPLHPLLTGMRNGSWLNAQEFPPLRYAVPGVIPEGLSLHVGPPKIGKSWALLGIALGVAVGGVALGKIRTGAPRPVLYLALEDGDRRLQNRCKQLLNGAPIPERLDYITRLTQQGSVLATIEAWLEPHGDEDPVVILDTLGKVMPPAMPGESAYQRDYRVGSSLKRLADDHPGTALIVNHHDRKAGSDDFVDAVSGTHGLAGAADTVLVLARRRHEATGVVKVTGRDVPEAEYALQVVDGAAWELDGPTLEVAAQRAVEQRSANGLSDRSLDVLAYVNGHPNGVTPAEVDAGLVMKDARQYLLRLAEQGRITKPRRGLYAPVSQASQRHNETRHRDTCDTALADEHDRARGRSLDGWE